MRRILFSAFLVALSLLPASAQPATPAYVTTYQRPDGNRVVGGSGTFPDARVIDIPLDGVPLWVVGQETASGDMQFSLVFEGGLKTVVLVRGETAAVTAGGALPAGATTPAILMPDGSGAPELPDLASATHAVRFGGGWLYVARNSGEVVLRDASGTEERLWLVALSDVRPVVLDGLAALYTGSTDRRYIHGAVGDGFEGSSLAVLAANDGHLEQVGGVSLGGEVFEGLSPLWADVDADGAPDLVTTVSSRAQGAQSRVYRIDGSLIAAGPALEQAYRWRHQIAFGAFGPNGENELAAVRTPHIGGVVEFYRLDGDRLEIVAELPGYSSHRFGSRNLDMALAGDFDGDGHLELVVPDETFTRLVGIQRTETGAEEVWSLPLDGELSTNLMALPLVGGRLALAAGMGNGTLRLWLPGA